MGQLGHLVSVDLTISKFMVATNHAEREGSRAVRFAAINVESTAPTGLARLRALLPTKLARAHQAT
jgi:hypothetical protein